jgi:hypothetical protein
VKLEGTLDAFGLPDVLQLLGFTKKTGVLHLVRAAERGQVAVRDGLLTGTTVDELARLLLWDDGSFSFDADVEVPDGDAAPHTEVLEQAQRTAAMWRTAIAMLPPDHHALSLATVVADPVTLDPRQWSLVARIDGRRPIAEICTDLADRAVLAGLLESGVVVPAPRAAAASTPAPTPAPPASEGITLSAGRSLVSSTPVPAPAGAGMSSFDTVGSLAMKPDMLLAPVAAPGINDVLLKRLAVAVRGL